MLGTWVADWLAFLLLLLSAVLGVIVGFLASLSVRRRWTLRIALADALVSFATTMVLSFIIYSVEAAHGDWESHNSIILAIALGIVALTRLLHRPVAQ